MTSKFFDKILPLNKVIKVLILSDFFLQMGWGMAGPIFAIFLTRQIQGGNLQTIGFAVASFWIIKSIAQPFIANYLDRNHGEIDDFYFLFGGMLAANIVPFGYIFSSLPWHIYFLEFTRGLAMACVAPTWAAFFTRHIDGGKEAFSWSIESTGIGFAAGFAGALGAWVASAFGFNVVFVLTGIFGLMASFLLLAIKKHIFFKNHFTPRFPPTHKPI